MSEYLCVTCRRCGYGGPHQVQGRERHGPNVRYLCVCGVCTREIKAELPGE